MIDEWKNKKINEINELLDELTSSIKNINQKKALVWKYLKIWDGKEKVLIYKKLCNKIFCVIGLGKNEQGILYPIIVIKGPNDKGIVINKNENTDF